MENYVLSAALIANYADNLRDLERSENTVKQYIGHLQSLMGWLNGRAITKQELIRWKRHLTERYAATTVNAMLAAVNGFLRFVGWNDMIVKLLKVQKALFCDERRQMECEEYKRLVRAASNRGDTRLSLLLQTICSTGIRVSELRFITVEAVRRGKTEVSNKGKRRMIILPDKLCRVLKQYAQKRGISSGAIFMSRTGKPLDRSNIWRAMKSLCAEANVDPSKTFPHNLRHLFARKFYAQEKDTYRLADILGHTSVNTTRIYTVENGLTHARLMNSLNLVLTT